MIDSTKFMDINGLSFLYNKLLEKLGIFEDETIKDIEKFKQTTLSDISNSIENISKVLDGKAEEAINAAIKVDDFISEVKNTYATKSEVNSIVNNLSSFEISVVQVLPKKGNSSTIYLMLASDGSGDDIYDEYLWIQETSKFEKIGTTRIDLTPYEKIEHADSTYVKKTDYNIKMSELEKRDADTLAKAISDAASKYVLQSAYNLKISSLEKADLDNLAAAKDDAASRYLKKAENAVSSSKLYNKRSINGTPFDGTSNITTNKWGLSRNISIEDSYSTNISEAVPVDGSSNSILKLPSNIKAATFTGSFIGNSSTATKLATARSIQTNLGSTSSASFDGSSNVSVGVTGTLPIINGGTGATSSKSAEYNILNGISSETSAIGDDTICACKYQNASSSTGVLYTRKFSYVWEYIKGKINSELGLSSNGSISGTASSANKLSTARTIALTGAVTGSAKFDGSGDVSIATSANHTHSYAGSNSVGGAANSAVKLATARNIALTGAVTGNAKFDGSGDISISTSANHSHNYAGSGSAGGAANSAIKLTTARSINGTNFDGSGNITTANWGTARNISISDSSSSNTGDTVSVNGSGNVTLKLPSTIKASLAGNASTASKLETARKIQIYDVAHAHGVEADFDGSGNALLMLPGTHVANINGAADYVKDFTSSSNANIAIGYAGSSLTSFDFLAAYTTIRGTRCIKDVASSTVRSWLGISQGTTVPTTLAQGNVFFLYNE